MNKFRDSGFNKTAQVSLFPRILQILRAVVVPQMGTL